ncbi:glycosyltransferase [Tropicibacter naphthalenivorans]|uniref:2-deoxystreptamine glucosyltransferase n=1 Tax=Tropicibacter naphthalenivorans TaxID=441103 RepID=A0A0P1H310_9RHOB|nr:glycosyltransferase [Tropicibacter naphthalenivorans]CUH82007.1 2-deoxystreptamine glucosyltransferase [Tropicibacter naphthalenivorans]SMD07713.1 Glycosyl transferases group 1 [Tropicibacter naphthalenivorans]
MPVIRFFEEDYARLCAVRDQDGAEMVQLAPPGYGRVPMARHVQDALAARVRADGVADLCHVRALEPSVAPVVHSCGVAKPAAKTDANVLILAPGLYQGGAFEDQIANWLSEFQGVGVTICLVQDVNPRRFRKLAPEVEVLTCGNVYFGDGGLDAAWQQLRHKRFDSVIVARSWMWGDPLVRQFVKGFQSQIVVCDRGMGYPVVNTGLQSLPESDIDRLYQDVDVVSLMLPAHNANFPEHFQARIQNHGLFPRLSDYKDPRPREQGAPLSVGYFGRLGPEKNLTELIEVFSRLASDETRSYAFHIIGDGTERATLEHLVWSYSMQDKVTFHGYMSDPGAAYGLLDLSVSMSGGEGIPNAVLESVQSGVPFIGLGSVPGHVHLVRNAAMGILVEAENSRAHRLRGFISAIQRFADQEADLDLWRQGARDVEAENSMAYVQRQWQRTLGFLLEGRTRVPRDFTPNPFGFSETVIPADMCDIQALPVGA